LASYVRLPAGLYFVFPFTGRRVCPGDYALGAHFLTVAAAVGGSIPQPGGRQLLKDCTMASDTHIRFSKGNGKVLPAACGCELRGEGVLLCPLHAAGPELLAACKVLLEDWLRLTPANFTDHTAKVHGAAKTAITKAETKPRKNYTDDRTVTTQG